MLEIGSRAPEFTLISDVGEEVSLSDFRGQKVVIYFYPKADTAGCTKQACAVRDHYPLIAEQNTVVIGISPDSPEELVKFRAKYELPFILLSDPEHQVAEAYGAWGLKKTFGKEYEGIIRSHIAMDGEGRIIEGQNNIKPLTTAELALKIIAI